jgi:hypothetical protein
MRLIFIVYLFCVTDINNVLITLGKPYKFGLEAIGNLELLYQRLAILLTVGVPWCLQPGLETRNAKSCSHSLGSWKDKYF